MINSLHRLLHDPARGWDPISERYAEGYSSRAENAEAHVIERIDKCIRGFEGKRIADLGSGPGQYGVEFARRGARVTCFDISEQYLRIARRRFGAENLHADFVLTYMDDIGRITPGRFDVVFSNLCWYYCKGDYGFARSIVRAALNSGVVIVRVQNAESDVTAAMGRRIRYWLYTTLRWKIGHLFPPRGRVEKALRATGELEVVTDYTNPHLDVVVARKRAISGLSQIEAPERCLTE